MVHRRNPWVPAEESDANNADEAISVEEAIRAYTLGGAYALLREDDMGSIEVGKYADFIVLDRNLVEIPVDDIDSTDVLRTVFNGQTVYERGVSAEPDDYVEGPDRLLSDAYVPD
jgi:predicted amidohydrolase YtcJ